MFSSRIFLTVCFTFSFIICLELIFVMGRHGSKKIPFFVYVYTVFPAPFIEDFLHWVTFTPLSKIICSQMWGSLLDFVSLHWFVCLYITVSPCLDNHSLRINLAIRLCQPSKFVVLFQSCFAYFMSFSIFICILESTSQFLFLKNN